MIFYIQLSLLNNYVRRGNRDSRVIGTLLGTNNNGVVEISDCFGVPYQERTGELFVAINTEYHANMYSCHRRINKKEYIVGWYATTAIDGALIVDNTSLINDFYSGECCDPIHLVVDTTLAGDKINIRGFVSQPIKVDDISFANMFQEVKVELLMTDSEIACLSAMVHGQKAEESFKSSEILSNVISEKDVVFSAVEKILSILDTMQTYVDGVVEGTAQPVSSIGVAISDALSSLKLIKSDEFHNLIADRKQDMLMVRNVYITFTI